MSKEHPNSSPETTENTEAVEATTKEFGEQAAPEKNFEEEIALLKDQLLRALAEVDNTQKRAQKEKEDTQKYAVTSFARDLLVTVDTLERALEAIPQAEREKEGVLKTLYEGLKLTHDELVKAFGKHKIEIVNPLHKPFDPLLHQAVNQVETKDHPSHTVVQVFQKGYTIHGRLLRPAMVSVAK